MINETTKPCCYCETGTMPISSPGRRCYQCRKEANRINSQNFRKTHSDYYYQSKDYQSKRKLTYEQRLKANVRSAVYNAVRKGELTKPDVCSICLQKSSTIEAHHNNYDKPLEVIWLCNICHEELHVRLRELQITN